MFDIVNSGNMYKKGIFHQKQYVVVIDNLWQNVLSIKGIYHVHVWGGTKIPLCCHCEYLLHTYDDKLVVQWTWSTNNYTE
jgi:hypothetical protein